MGRPRKKNKWELNNQIATGYTSKGEKFIIDSEDIKYVENYTWYIQRKIVNGQYIGGEYIVAQFPMVEGKRVRKFLHNIIWENNYGKIPEDKIVDHIDRDPKNNSKSNLRLVTQKQNTKNRTTQSNNSSGVTGVSYDYRRSVWVAYIQIDFKRINLGSWETKENAIKERLKAEKKYFKEFAPQKYLFKEYGIE